jgi:hypothetical protein
MEKTSRNDIWIALFRDEVFDQDRKKKNELLGNRGVSQVAKFCLALNTF